MAEFPESLIIIGAPRSGTNILRDVLTALPGIETWPCDEINFVWKHGNISYPYDDLPSDAAGPSTRRYVRNQFAKIARKSSAACVVEKTCANSLRLSYVNAIVPEAKYILLVRDGYDAVASTMHRWETPISGQSYYLNKARFVAPADLLPVVWQTLKKRLTASKGPESKSWSTWGPLTAELESCVAEGRSLADICSLQWAQCVSRSMNQIRKIPSTNWLAISYEEFVRNPERQVGRILALTGQTADSKAIEAACSRVNAGSIGKAKQKLDEAQIHRVAEQVDPVMARVRELLVENG